jgi:hypothetical protein
MRRLQEQRPQPKKTVLVGVPLKMVSVARKLSTTEQRKEQNSFSEITGTSHRPKDNSVKMLGLGITFSTIFNDTYRMIIPMESIQAMKTNKKCKHLLNFPTVTLLASYNRMINELQRI